MKRILLSTLASALILFNHASRSETTIDRVRDSEWFLAYLDVENAHKVSKGENVLVALPDSGVALHPDIEKNVLLRIDLTTASSSSGQSDLIGHGTEMAGLIAGHGHGYDKGILGIAPAARILSLNVYARDESAPELERGIKVAAEKGAGVINISAAVGPSQEIQRAVAAATKADAIIVASSGNEPKGKALGYPAAMPGVLAVGAISENGKRADFSVTGSNIQLCAPGADITTTGTQSAYRSINGTSAAAAITSGAAALVRSKFPKLSAQDVIHRLTSTATDIGPPGRDDECGFGVLNIVKALTADVPPLASDTKSSAPSHQQATPTTSEDSAESSHPGTGGAALAAILGGVSAIAATATLLVFLASRRRRRDP